MKAIKSMIWYGFIYVDMDFHLSLYRHSKKQTRACHYEYLESLSTYIIYLRCCCCCWYRTHNWWRNSQKKSSPNRKWKIFCHVKTQKSYLKSAPLVLVPSHAVPLVLLGSFFQSAPHVGFAFFVGIFVAWTFSEPGTIFSFFIGTFASPRLESSWRSLF